MEAREPLGAIVRAVSGVDVGSGQIVLNWVIACAVIGKADVIVSGDRDLLDLKRVGEIPILSARQLLLRLQGLKDDQAAQGQAT